MLQPWHHVMMVCVPIPGQDIVHNEHAPQYPPSSGGAYTLQKATYMSELLDTIGTYQLHEESCMYIGIWFQSPSDNQLVSSCLLVQLFVTQRILPLTVNCERVIVTTQDFVKHIVRFKVLDLLIPKSLQPF